MVTYCPKCSRVWRLSHRIPPQQIACPRCNITFALETWYDNDVEIDPGSEEIMATPVVDEQKEQPYHSTMNFALITAGILLAMMALSMFELWFLDNSLSDIPAEAAEITAENYDNPPPPPRDERLEHLFRGDFAVFTAAWIFLLIAFAVTWIFWASLTYRNLYALVPNQLTFTPGSLIFWHLIPVANLFVPIIAMYEIWKSGNPRFLGVFKRDSNGMLFGMLLLGISFFAQFVIIFMALFFPADISYAINSMISRLILKNFVFFITTPFLILSVIMLTVNQGRRWNLVMAKRMEKNYLRREQQMGSA